MDADDRTDLILLVLGLSCCAVLAGSVVALIVYCVL